LVHYEKVVVKFILGLILLLLSLTSYSGEIKDLLLAFEEAKQSEKSFILTEIESKMFNHISSVFEQSTLNSLDSKSIAAQDFFNERLLEWESEFNKVNFKELLKEIRDDGKDALNKKTIKYLKDHRSALNKLRITFFVFDQNHEAPIDFHQFVTDLGKLNDAIASGKNSKIIKYSERSLESLKKIKNLDLKNDFKALNDVEFDHYITELQKESLLLVNKNSLNLDEFHDLRKNFKNFLSVYQSIEMDSGFKAQTSELLDELVTGFGDINDIYTDLKITKAFEIQDREIVLTPELRSNLKKGLKFLKNDLCNMRFQ
jgi:hypothetical protein